MSPFVTINNNILYYVYLYCTVYIKQSSNIDRLQLCHYCIQFPENHTDDSVCTMIVCVMIEEYDSFVLLKFLATARHAHISRQRMSRNSPLQSTIKRHHSTTTVVTNNHVESRGRFNISSEHNKPPKYGQQWQNGIQLQQSNQQTYSNSVSSGSSTSSSSSGIRGMKFVNCRNKKRTEQIVSGNNNLFPRENLIFNRFSSALCPYLSPPGTRGHGHRHRKWPPPPPLSTCIFRRLPFRRRRISPRKLGVL